MSEPLHKASSLAVHAISLFEPMFEAITRHGITGRAFEQGLWSLKVWNPRDQVQDNYRRIDDRPYGGGPGMVMLLDPLVRCLKAIRAAGIVNAPVLCVSPRGQPLTHRLIGELRTHAELIVVCGRYEGIDQRFIDTHVTYEVAVGDVVVSGGELPAMMLIDALVRWIPGAVQDAQSVEQDSFAQGLLDCPHYSRPPHHPDGEVPAVLQSGNHAAIARWRHEQALLHTARVRPDLIAQARAAGQLSSADEVLLRGAG
jgi:tRNA (guanine37-N1)-methyltransferase